MAKRRQKAESEAVAGRQPTKAERRQARGGGKKGRSPEKRIEERLARIERAVAAQAELNDELRAKLDQVLAAARKPAGG